jgi:dihydroorotate dehydrogenase
MDVYTLARAGLFKMDPEDAHHLTLAMASRFPALAFPWSHRPSPRLLTPVGLTPWRSPIGLAAGLDKNAEALTFFEKLGLGSMECGTITPLPQQGNPRPRMFRYPAELSLRNSMGFPNAGLTSCAGRLAHRPKNFPVGVNIGKSKAASASEALEEYAELYEKLAPLGDWVVINISSPNTPGLRDLQQEGWLKDLFNQLRPLKAKLSKEIFVKLSPDLEDADLAALTHRLAELGADGLVATNTTHSPERGVGGLSGRLLRVKAHQKRRVILEAARSHQLPVVGVGGFEDMRDVMAWWASGGSALQIYTAFVFQGPAMVGRLEKQMLAFLDRAGLADLATFFTLTPTERQRLVASFAR